MIKNRKWNLYCFTGSNNGSQQLRPSIMYTILESAYVYGFGRELVCLLGVCVCVCVCVRVCEHGGVECPGDRCGREVCPGKWVWSGRMHWSRILIYPINYIFLWSFPLNWIVRGNWRVCNLVNQVKIELLSILKYSQFLLNTEFCKWGILEYCRNGKGW